MREFSTPFQARFIARSPALHAVGAVVRYIGCVIAAMKRTNFLALALAAGAAPLMVVLSAKADLAQMTDGAPFVVIRSHGGQITVRPGEPEGVVRVPGNAPGVQMNRFNVDRQNYGKITVPGFQGGGRRPFGKGFNIPMRQFNVPNLREGPHGISIQNPGGDLPVNVPNRVEAMMIDAGASPVLMEQTRGPYGIVGQGDVTLHGVSGAGFVRTSGNIDVRNPAGGMRLDQIASGHVAVVSGPELERAQVNSIDGEVDWTFNGVGSGPYRVTSSTGPVKIFVRQGVSASIEAFSEQGTVTSTVDPAMANVLAAHPHSVSLTVGGGGPQIIVLSSSGNITIATAP